MSDACRGSVEHKSCEDARCLPPGDPQSPGIFMPFFKVQPGNICSKEPGESFEAAENSEEADLERQGPGGNSLGTAENSEEAFLIGRKFRERSLLKQGIFLFNILYKKFTKILFKPLA